MKLAVKLLLVLVILVLPIIAQAYKNPGQPSGYINDFAVVLSPEQKTSLESKIKEFDQKTGNEIAIVIIPSLDGDALEDYAVELFKDWGIGKKNKDNGILLLVAIDDRKMRIEVGYGLEGLLTDAQSSWIINEQMKPAFRKNDYFGGLNSAVDKIISATQGEAVPTANENSSQAGNFPFEALFYFGIFFVQILAAILGKSKSWWAGGVVGGFSGLMVGIFQGLYWGIGSALLLIPLGLLFDYIVSVSYAKGKASGHMAWWLGGTSGRNSSGGSGFGGFGGGSSGGGGASGRW